MTPPRMRPALAVTAIASLLFATIALPAPVAAEEPEPPADPGVVAAEQAAEEGQAVEVDEWTDEHSITHANPDGTFTLETGYEAARVKREGEWILVDTAIEAAPDGRLRPAAAALDMDFSAGNDSHLATVTVDEHSLALHVPFTLTTPVITDDVITYPEVLPGVDLVVSVKPEEFSEVLVVKTAEAAANPVLQTFDLRVETTAVDRMQPSGLGSPAGAGGAGRSISPGFVEDVLTTAKPSPVVGPYGEPRLSYVSGTVEVITENDIVVTVITR